jgi:hypothetical protein
MSIKSLVDADGIVFQSIVEGENSPAIQSIINSSQYVDVTFSAGGVIYQAGDGLSLTADRFDVNVDKGLQIIDDNVQLANTVAGEGLVYNEGVLSVDELDGGIY